MSRFNDLAAAVTAEPALDAALTLLLDRLADEVRATSNDQNIQRLARDLRSAAPTLVRAVAGKRVPGLAA